VFISPGIADNINHLCSDWLQRLHNVSCCFLTTLDCDNDKLARRNSVNWCD